METVHTAEPPEGTGMFAELNGGAPPPPTRQPAPRAKRAYRSGIDAEAASFREIVRLYAQRDRATTDDERDRIDEQIRAASARNLKADDQWRTAFRWLVRRSSFRPPQRRRDPHAARVTRRPRARGAGNPAGTRRAASSSTSSGADPGDDGPAPAHSRRPRRAGGRWDSC